MLTQDRLRELLLYSPESGVFTRKVSLTNTVKVGDIAGTLNNGYISIYVDGKPYHAHRLAFLYVHGFFPKEIDHINRVKNDNRILNLRDTNRASNNRNTPVRTHSQVGVKNVKLDKRDSKYSVVFVIDNKQHSFGRFDNLEDASRKSNYIRSQLFNL